MTETTRCLCGETTAQFDPDHINWQGLCHCDSCRRASGAPVVGWFGVANGSWAWAGAPPKTYHSSNGVTRFFCAVCGTPMAYEATRWPGEIHFTAATLEQPEQFKPDSHYYDSEHLTWLKIEDGLPRHAQAGPSSV